MRTDSAAALLDLILPRECAGCGSAGRRFCNVCRQSLEREQVRPALGQVAGLPLAAVAQYGGVTRSSLIAYKEHGALAVAAPLGEALAQAVARLPGLDARCLTLWLIPAPSGRGVDRRRGASPMLELAKEAASALRRRGWRVVVCPAAISVRHRLDQVGLSENERRANLSGAIALRPIRIPIDAAIILVDDISTSGATLTELARAVRAGGHIPFGAAVVALTSAEQHLRLAATGTNVEVVRERRPKSVPRSSI
ncbi:MAG: ComF family protein [Actinomycetes bacterium]